MENKVRQDTAVAATNENPLTVLVVEDDVGLNHLIRKTLEREGFKTEQALNGAEAIAAVRAIGDTVILLDYLLPDMNGKQVILALREETIETPVIIMTGNGDEKIAVETMKLGVRDYLIKEQGFIDKLPKTIRQTIASVETEKKISRISTELRESEMRYRRLFESAKDGILILEFDNGQVMDVNPFLTDLLGYSRVELLGKSIWELGEFKDVVSSHEAFKELQDKEYIRYDDLPLKTREGRVINVEFVSNVYLVNHSKVIQCNIRDITERRQVERALLESETRFRAIAENSHNAIGIIDEKARFVWFNDRMVEISGYAREQIMQAASFMVFLAPDSVEFVSNNFMKFVSGQPYDHRYTFTFLRSDGTMRIAEKYMTDFIDKDGKRNLIIHMLDVTERNQAEDKVKSQLTELRRWQNVMLGREDRVQEIKREVNELCRSFGEPVRYPSQTDGSPEELPAKGPIS